MRNGAHGVRRKGNVNARDVLRDGRNSILRFWTLSTSESVIKANVVNMSHVTDSVPPSMEEETYIAGSHKCSWSNKRF